ncbi:MAG: SHOCT domain-containing protein [Acidimicrobiia bacterium]
MSAERQFKKAAKRGDPVVMINLGSPAIRNPGKGIAKVTPFATKFGYEYVGTQQAVLPGVRASTLMAEFRLRSNTSTAPPPATDIPEQLRRLGELRDSGVLTEEEFQSKKADLLRRL